MWDISHHVCIMLPSSLSLSLSLFLYAQVHRGKPLPSVHYSKPMPDIERLMQVWPSQFEEMLKTVTLPGADIELDVKEFAKVVCMFNRDN